MSFKEYLKEVEMAGYEKFVPSKRYFLIDLNRDDPVFGGYDDLKRALYNAEKEKKIVVVATPDELESIIAKMKE